MNTVSRVAAFSQVFFAALLAGYAGQAGADFDLRVQTDMGSFDIEMLDSVAPQNVANFMKYVNRGDYDGSVFHRYAESPSGVPFVLQGGGYFFDAAAGPFLNGGALAILADPPVVNEFNLSNTRGTIAMAKVAQQFDSTGAPVPGTGPDSATNQWFFNLSDNSMNLDTQNGGFTVFARVKGNGMNVIDAIADLGVVSSCFMYEIPIFLNCGGTFFNMPTTLRGGVFDDDTLFNIHSIGLDADADGAIDKNEIDGDAAGGPDSSQPNVASAPLLDNTNEYITVAAPVAYPLNDFTVLGSTYMLTRQAISECDLNAADLVYGLTSFRVTGLAPGGSVNVNVILPVGSTPDAYYIYGPEPGNTKLHWYKAVQFAGAGTPGVSFNSHVVTLHLTDNGWGDADMTPDGVITVAPGGAANTIVPPVASDGDCDGVDDAEEASLANNGGDGNSDGLQDNTQSHVASLQDVNSNFVTIEAILPGQNIEYAKHLDSDNLFRRYFFASNPPPFDGFNFPSGFFQFSVSNVTPGGMAEIMFTLPGGAVADTYKVLGPDTGTPSWHWHDFTFNGVTGTVVNMNDRSEMTLYVQDGGRGDNDRAVNGVVYLIGAPGEIITVSSSSGGGCSLLATESAARKAGAWWLIFGLLMIYRPLRKLLQ